MHLIMHSECVREMCVFVIGVCSLFRHSLIKSNVWMSNCLYRMWEGKMNM